jgi:hypothetical protein
VGCLVGGHAWRQPAPLATVRLAPIPAPELIEEATMRRNHPEPDNSAFDSAGLVRRRQLEKSVSLSGRERFRCLWYRLRLTIAEMNYASRRMVELQRQL